MGNALTGKTILITSGPTRAPIDAVRFISNRSTGRLGSRIAETALQRGARVLFVCGPDSQRPDIETERLVLCPVETVDDLLETLEERLRAEPVDALVHAMAVLDYVPAEPTRKKLRSEREEWTLRLVRTPKVITRIRQWAPECTLVGFKLLSDASEEELIEAALHVAQSAGAALMVANDLTRISGERHPALLLRPDGAVIARPRTKVEIAEALCDWLGGR